MADSKYQIFISSTYEDLKEERNAAIKAILEMGHIPVGMEMFSAADEQQWEIIRRAIDASDYYIVILAHRYGSVTPEEISYTRKEYEYAAHAEVPILGFLVEDEVPWLPGSVDQDELATRRLNDFKQLVRTKPISRWSSADDLYGKCSIALGKAFNTTPRPGWARIGPDRSSSVVAEVSRLSSENADLRDKLSEAQTLLVARDEDSILETVEILEGNLRTFDLTVLKDGRSETVGQCTASLADILTAMGPVLQYDALHPEDAPDLVSQSINPNYRNGIEHIDSRSVLAALLDLDALAIVQDLDEKYMEGYLKLTLFGREVLRELRRASLRRKSTRDSTTPPKE